MLKKLFITGAVLSVLGLVLFGSSAIGHLKQGVSWVQSQVSDNVPIEYELDRARALIEDTEPQMKQCKRIIAEKQVEIHQLKQDLRDLERRNDVAKTTLQMQAAALETQQVSYRCNGRVVTRAQMKHDAARRLSRVKAADQMLRSKNARLGALENTLAAALQTLDELKTQRQTLETKCAMLEAKLRETEAKKAMTLSFDVDDSNLAQANQILSSIQKRLDVEIQMMENEKPLLDEIPSTTFEDEDVGSQISAYLEGRPSDEPVFELPRETTVVDATANK